MHLAHRGPAVVLNDHAHMHHIRAMRCWPLCPCAHAWPAPLLCLVLSATTCRLQELWRGKVEQISWSPRAFVYHNFLSDEECEHLKALAKKRLTKSTVRRAPAGPDVRSQAQ